MKIAVIGLYFATNLGDAVICDSVAYLLKERFPEAEVEVIDIEGKTAFPGVYRVSRRTMIKRKMRLDWEYWQTRHHIKDWVYYFNEVDVATRQEFYDGLGEQRYDVVVFAGGQLFMDWLSVDVCEILKRFEKKNIPVIFNACGTGLAISDKIKELLSDHLQADNVKLVSSRDDVALINQRYLTGEKKAQTTYDPALWTSEVYQVKAEKNKVLGLGVMYSTHASYGKLVKFWVKLIKELDKRNIKWKMFCNGAGEDYDFGCYVLEKLKRDPKEYLCERPVTPEELVTQIAQFDSLISFRLHSHIIASSLDIPGVAVVWDEKLRFFYRHLGHEERCKTVKDSPIEVLAALEKAKQEGYDREKIQKQKNYAKNLLLDKVTEVTGHE